MWFVYRLYNFVCHLYKLVYHLYFFEEFFDYPVLLLDDVLSELDGERQNQLLLSIHHIQTMITCTGLDDFVNNRFPIDKIFKVIDGTVVNEN